MSYAETPTIAQSDRAAAERPAQLTGGKLRSAISTSIVAILRDHYGRGPMEAKTYAMDDIILVVLRGSGFTPLERTIMESGRPDRVIAMRQSFHGMMAERYTDTVEQLTGINVVAFLSQAHVGPDVTTEIFLMERAVEGWARSEP